MTNEEIAAFLDAFRMFERVPRSDGIIEFVNRKIVSPEKIGSGSAHITELLRGYSGVELTLSPWRAVRLGCKTNEHDKVFKSAEAAANYALVNGLLV